MLPCVILLWVVASGFIVLSNYFDHLKYIFSEVRTTNIYKYSLIYQVFVNIFIF